MIKTLTTNQNPFDIKELEYLEWQATKIQCTYKKKKKIGKLLSVGVYANIVIVTALVLIFVVKKILIL